MKENSTFVRRNDPPTTGTSNAFGSTGTLNASNATSDGVLDDSSLSQSQRSDGCRCKHLNGQGEGSSGLLVEAFIEELHEQLRLATKPKPKKNKVERYPGGAGSIMTAEDIAKFKEERKNREKEVLEKKKKLAEKRAERAEAKKAETERKKSAKEAKEAGKRGGIFLYCSILSLRIINIIC